MKIKTSSKIFFRRVGTVLILFSIMGIVFSMIFVSKNLAERVIYFILANKMVVIFGSLLLLGIILWIASFSDNIEEDYYKLPISQIPIYPNFKDNNKIKGKKNVTRVEIQRKQKKNKDSQDKEFNDEWISDQIFG